MKKKGFTLVELVGVIVIISLIAILAVPQIINQVKRKQNELSDVTKELFYSATSLYLDANRNKYEDYIGNVYCISLRSLLENEFLTEPIIDAKTRKKVDLDTTIEVRLDEKLNKNYNIVDPHDCSAVIRKINAPELLDNLIPIKRVGNSWIYANTNEEWYNYDKKEWANAVVLNSGVHRTVGDVINESDIDLWYVWIPRYRYQLFNANNGSVDPQQINIEFEAGTDTTGTVRCTTQTSGSGTSSEVCTNATNGNWYTHPAFTFGTQQLTGIWVGKFETTTTDTECTNNACNKTLTVAIKPNVRSWRSATVSNQYASIKKIEKDYSLSSYDSHMMKNMEWGAVAYLSHSKYGIGEEVYINNSGSYYTGRSGGNVAGSSNTVATQYPGQSTLTYRTYNYGYYTYDGKVVNYDGTIGEYTTDRTLGTKASTTGNIYGIYDMSGGAAEYVMGNEVNSSNAFYSSSSDFATAPDSKYYDVYTYDGSSNTTFVRGKLGDATKETLKTSGSNTSSWYSDYSYFLSSTSAWFKRGCDFSNDTGAGVFSFVGNNGGGYNYNSVRAVLTKK